MLLRRFNQLLGLSRMRFSSASSSVSIADTQSASLEENCILVDEQDNIIGSETKRFCHLVQPNGQLPLHRAFSVFLFNKQGELLLQQRSRHKVTFPEHITNSCCSHPLHDILEERDEENAIGVKLAALRRLNFELGIPLNQVNVEDFSYLTRIHYKATDDNIWGEHEIDYILFLQKNVDIKPNPDEVANLMFVSHRDFDSFLASHDIPVTPWFRLISRHYLDDWWSNLGDLERYKDHKKIHKFQ